jgi:hypothetical protein
MLNGFVPYKDPRTGLECNARIVECRWLERGKVLNTKTNVLEVETRQVRIEPTKLEKAFTGKLLESDALNHLQESDWFSYGLDGGPSGIPGVYLPMPPGPYTKQLYLQDRWMMKAKCFQAKNHNPILKGAVAILTAFVIGDGVDIASEDQQAQAVWDEFEERTQLQRRLPTFSDMLSTDGDLFWRCKRVKPGYLDLVSLDSGTIWEIITDPEDIRQVFGYWRQFSTAYQIFTVNGVKSVEYIIEIVPADEVIHLKVNCQESEKFGRSDLFSTLSTAAMLDEIMKYRGIRIMNEAALCIDHSITGDGSDIDRIAQERQIPLGPGTETFHPANETIAFHAWPGSGTPKSGFHEESIANIGQGFGVPKEYLGAGSQGSRAAALTSTEPAAKLMKRRQTEFEYCLHELYRKVIQEAKRAGRLPMECSEKCECTFPELVSENKSDRLNRLVIEEHQKYFTRKRCAEMAARLEDVTTFDFSDEDKAIQQEQANAVANDPISAALYGGKSPSTSVGGGGSSSTGVEGGGQMSMPGMESTNNDVVGLSDKSRGQLKDQLRTRESEGGTGKQPFSIQAARFELSKMRKAGFRMVEGDEVIPSEWKGTVKKMLKHPEIDNPYALVNWMDAQGYTPH